MKTALLFALIILALMVFINACGPGATCSAALQMAARAINQAP